MLRLGRFLGLTAHDAFTDPLGCPHNHLPVEITMAVKNRQNMWNNNLQLKKWYRSVWRDCIYFINNSHFQWSWTTPTPGFKVTPFFDAEYLRNGTTYRHSCNGILMGLTHALLNSAISNDLEWLSKISNDTKRRTVSLWQLSFLSNCVTKLSQCKHWALPGCRYAFSFALCHVKQMPWLIQWSLNT